jgi:hypothetical protein
VSTDVNFLFRMLEARALKRLLASSGAELAMIISEPVHRDLVTRFPDMADRNAFRRVRLQVRYTRTRAWACIPGAARLAGTLPGDSVRWHLADRCGGRHYSAGTAALTTQPLTQSESAQSLPRWLSAALSWAGCRVGAYQVRETVCGSGREGLNQ